MPYEFALRPRIRLREGFEPPRRVRARLPKIALPVLAYWGVAAAITYQLLHWHDQPEAAAQAALAPPVDQGPHWWDVPPSALPGVAPKRDVERVPVPPHAVEPPLENDVPRVEEPIAEEPEPSDSLATTPSFARDESDFERRYRRDPRSANGSNPRGESRAEREAEEYGRKLALRDAPTDADSTSTSTVGRSVSNQSIAAPGVLGLSPLDSQSANQDAPRGPQLLGAVPPDAPAQVASALPSCEAAQARANQDVTIGADNGAPDLSREAIAHVLDNGVWIARCDIPMTTSVELCVAIQGGKVIGASVSSHPASTAINACVKRRAASLSFPYSARIDLARTHF